jgi:hypothetical protein
VIYLKREKGLGMQVQITVAIISGLCVAIPSLIATLVSNISNKNIVIYRINQLEEKVHAHNNLIDRMYSAEKRIAILEDNIKER